MVLAAGLRKDAVNGLQGGGRAFVPSTYTTAVDNDHIARLRFEWYYSVQDELQSRLEAEVNTDNGRLESLYYDDKAYWNCRPPIDVPISVQK